MMLSRSGQVFPSLPDSPAALIGTPAQDARNDAIADVPELTHVEIQWDRQRVENRIRFGRFDQQHMIDRHWRVVSFAAGSIFAFVRWTAGDYGTTLSRIDILRAVAPGKSFVTIPYVHPGAESLLHVSGWPKVEKALQVIDVIEALGIDPADVAPEHWRHVHNRLSVGEKPRPYSRSRHQAWLQRRRVMS